MHSENCPLVCCFFAEYRMGKANSPYYLHKKYTDKIYDTPDDSESRLRYFKKMS